MDMSFKGTLLSSDLITKNVATRTNNNLVVSLPSFLDIIGVDWGYLATCNGATLTMNWRVTRWNIVMLGMPKGARIAVQIGDSKEVILESKGRRSHDRTEWLPSWGSINSEVTASDAPDSPIGIRLLRKRW